VAQGKTPKHLWEGQEEEAVSYLKEMVAHPASVYGLLGMLALGAVVSIPLGLGVGVIPLLAFAAGESIAALFVPNSPVFREMVDRKKRRERREKFREHLTDKIESKVGGDHPHWAVYQRMRERLTSLQEIAANRATSLSPYDVERLDEATVDYLGLWLARLVMSERRATLDERGIKARIESIDKQIEGVAGVERKRLAKARQDLERILKRRTNLTARETAVEAAMLSMSDTFEEVYQRVMTDPTSTDVAQELQNAVERLGIEEELDFAVEEELGDLLQARKDRVAHKAAQKASQAQSRSL